MIVLNVDMLFMYIIVLVFGYCVSRVVIVGLLWFIVIGDLFSCMMCGLLSFSVLIFVW